MSTTKKVETNQSTKTNLGNQTFLFDKSNYIWMLGGIVIILIGLFLMSGGKNPDPNKFDYNVIYSITRVTVAPILILLGFALEIYAIMKKPSSPTTEQ